MDDTAGSFRQWPVPAAARRKSTDASLAVCVFSGESTWEVRAAPRDTAVDVLRRLPPSVGQGAALLHESARLAGNQPLSTLGVSGGERLLLCLVPAPEPEPPLWGGGRVSGPPVRELGCNTSWSRFTNDRPFRTAPLRRPQRRHREVARELEPPPPPVVN
eukprot:Hpha_TRINITY_DN12225_c1_g1::TRINITY_DN12225_c1_g1_i1::g.17109::m.17109